jgi:MOSC domain-containing protein YiiM
MKVVSVNVGLPREVVWKGMTVQTAIFKAPVAGTVAIRELNLLRPAGRPRSTWRIGEGGLRLPPH